MRLAAILTVFDSADIAEMLVRHTMPLVDRIDVHDDGSPDATREMLRRRAAPPRTRDGVSQAAHRVRGFLRHHRRAWQARPR